MNLHPLVVHFPVAFLIVYAVIEFLRFRKLTEQSWYFFVKAILLIIGTAGAFAALLTSNQAQLALYQGGVHSPLQDPWVVVGFHDNFARLTIVLFGFLSICYLVQVLKRMNLVTRIQNQFFNRVFRFFEDLSDFILNTPFVFLLAFLGLISIAVTGALGGSIVYGVDNDPFANFVVNLLK